MSAVTISAGVPLAAERVVAHDARAMAVLIPGSGPIDRDGDAAKLPLGIQRQLADGLCERGVSSIRWDKRGVGESGGDFLSTGLHDLVDDALAVVDEAMSTGLPVVVIGHSEGTAIAARLLVERPAIAGAVLLSPYARTGLEVLRWQARSLVADVPAFVRGLLRLMRTDLESQTEKNRQRLLATTRDVERIGGVRVNARWFREFMAYDPRADLGAATQPVLALAAGHDLQSPPDDAEAIAAHRTAPTRVVRLDGLSHIMRSQEAPTLRTYRQDARRPIDERIVPLISAWIEQLVSR
ncbi:alpha/beta fold hydrolase [Microcella sp.]|uniref:alpha/beta fold hydrolase n=1 Tax=Microcella sp. TaxID=1913979 RepID=UPI002566AE3B|nr:alpha/beta fold hydrolase [Microcella sp.]MBX9470413.1 lysophospholipase [Microcella sp.]